MAGTLIIGGTGAYHLALDRLGGGEMITTPFGQAGPIYRFRAGQEECAFLSRHGGQGSLGLTPPFINYRANLWAAREIGARRVLSWNSAGSLVRALRPGSIAAVADLIDWTRRRATSFGSHRPDRRPASGPLLDPALRSGLVRAAGATGYPVTPGALYAATDGPRLETVAEIRLLAAAGAELVGMTLSPELFLARELGLGYGALCWVSNYATGVPFDGPEQRLFGPEVGRLLFGVIRRFLCEEGTPSGHETRPDPSRSDPFPTG